MSREGCPRHQQKLKFKCPKRKDIKKNFSDVMQILNFSLLVCSLAARADRAV